MNQIMNNEQQYQPLPVHDSDWTGPSETKQEQTPTVFWLSHPISTILYVLVMIGLNLYENFICPPAIPTNFLHGRFCKVHSLVIIATGATAFSLAVKAGTFSDDKTAEIFRYGVAATTFSVTHFLAMIGSGHSASTRWVVGMVLRGWVAVRVGFAFFAVFYSSTHKMQLGQTTGSADLPLAPAGFSNLKALAA